ncbi:hypothetical protein BN12_1470005 [Nostocoides japonicum T1-X7]|uniref:DUF4244 domain-containing protein n=1 Tax=Nostocoides japonicum T1-X7 TaxID=1194083 RepID=A0A077LXQ5_9MICO|nr:hypothetical protein [Tetrasphaera japonica]CCH76779.1 hypothetical protein BN12_1470005 [Tetrasphaera japonica T1-X7]
MTTTATRLYVRTRLVTHERLRRLADPAERERGDVPGWVFVTLMTAGLVAALWALASGQLQALFSRALASVTGP